MEEQADEDEQSLWRQKRMERHEDIFIWLLGQGSLYGRGEIEGEKMPNEQTSLKVQFCFIFEPALHNPEDSNSEKEDTSGQTLKILELLKSQLGPRQQF